MTIIGTRIPPRDFNAPAAAAADKPKTKLVMQGDLLLVEEVKPPEQTAGGVLLPQSHRAFKYKTATVVSVGQGSTTMSGARAAMAYKEGDRILFNADAGLALAHGGKSYLVLGEGDIIAIEQPVVN